MDLSQLLLHQPTHLCYRPSGDFGHAKVAAGKLPLIVDKKLVTESGSEAHRLADAVAADAAEAFARFVAARGDHTIVALALCSVDDAVPPYIMGATLDDIGPIHPTERKTWRANPADWSWNDPGKRYRCNQIVGEILDDERKPFKKRAGEIFQGIVSGLKNFDASGNFQGKLPRDQMLLLLWIHDPSDANAKSVMKWVAQTNPKPVSQWFNAVYPFRP